MKRKINKPLRSIMACLLLLTLISSCKKEEENVNNTPTTTVDQDQQNILTTSDDLADEMVDVSNTEAAEAGASLTSLMDKSPAFGKKGNIKDQIGAKLRTLMYKTKEALHIKNKHAGKTTESEPFDFNSRTGTYTWNASMEKWNIQPNNPSDKIIINFPSDTNNASNNDARITISAFEEQLVTMGDTSEQYLPTKLVANLTISEVEVGSVDYTGTFNNDGTPVTINLTLKVNPYTLTVVLNNQTTTVTADVKLTKDGQTIIGINGSLVFVDASQEKIKTIDATVQVKQLSVSASINVEAIEAVEEPTVTDLNNNIKVAVSYGGTKVGDIVFVEGDAENMEVLIKFKDGSTEPAEEFFAEVKKKIEDALGNISFGKK